MGIPYINLSPHTSYDPDNLLMYAMCHHHRHGDTLYVVLSDHEPTEQEVVNQILESNFEPDKDEYLTIEIIEKVQVLTEDA